MAFNQLLQRTNSKQVFVDYYAITCSLDAGLLIAENSRSDIWSAWAHLLAFVLYVDELC